MQKETSIVDYRGTIAFNALFHDGEGQENIRDAKLALPDLQEEGNLNDYLNKLREAKVLFEKPVNQIMQAVVQDLYLDDQINDDTESDVLVAIADFKKEQQCASLCNCGGTEQEKIAECIEYCENLIVNTLKYHHEKPSRQFPVGKRISPTTLKVDTNSITEEEVEDMTVS